MSGEIASALVKIKGVFFQVDIDPDYDCKPTDSECYSDADVKAWRADAWRYVGVTVSVRDYPSISTALWGLEWGESAEWRADMSKIVTEYPVPDLVTELRADVVKLLAEWGE
jgi:hypothetical protein